MKYLVLKSIVSLAIIGNMAQAANTATKSAIMDRMSKIESEANVHFDKISRIAKDSAQVQTYLVSNLKLDSKTVSAAMSVLKFDASGKLDQKSKDLITNLNKANALKDLTSGMDAAEARVTSEVSDVLSEFIIKAEKSVPNVVTKDGAIIMNESDTATTREFIARISKMSDALGKMETSEKSKYLQLMKEFNQIVQAGFHPSEAIVQGILRTKFNNDQSKRAEAVELSKKGKDCV